MLSLVCFRARANSENELRESSIGAPITAVRRGRPEKRRRTSLETSLIAAPLSALLCGGGGLRTHVTRTHRVSPTPAQVPPGTVPQTRPRGQGAITRGEPSERVVVRRLRPEWPNTWTRRLDRVGLEQWRSSGDYSSSSKKRQPSRPIKRPKSASASATRLAHPIE